MSLQPTTAETPDRESPRPSKNGATQAQPSTGQVLGKRRRFVIDRTSQLRTGLLITGVALVLIVLLNFSLHSTREQATAAVAIDSPQLAPLLQSQNRFELILGIAASVVFLVGVFVVTILETHKTAGAAYHVCRELERVRDGLYGIPMHLRKDDNLRDIESAFNDMGRSLAERATVEAEELDHAASVADRISNPAEAHALAGALRDMADEQRRLVRFFPSWPLT